MQRLGLCCIFIEAPIKFRTTTAKFVSSLSAKGQDPLQYLSDLIQGNLHNLSLAIAYCAQHGIGCFRINSGLLPIYTHPSCGYALDDLPNSEMIRASFGKVRLEAQKLNIRLTFHPDQFVVLNSPREDVVHKSIADLEYHGLMAELVGADVINIHGGGGYGNKKEALLRFAKNFDRLSERVKRCLTIENDDLTFSPADLLPLCHKLEIPLVYDVHHHRCLTDVLSIEEATKEALATWNREPLFHVSSPQQGWSGKNLRLHADYINLPDMPGCWKTINPLTIEVEAKAKELAVIQLQKSLKIDGWNL